MEEASDSVRDDESTVMAALFLATAGLSVADVGLEIAGLLIGIAVVDTHYRVLICVFVSECLYVRRKTLALKSRPSVSNENRLRYFSSDEILIIKFQK